MLSGGQKSRTIVTRNQVELQKDMTVVGKVEGRKAKFLVDSGSELSICSKEFYDNNLRHIKLRPSSFRSVKSVNGKESRLTGNIEVKVKIANLK